MKASYTQPPWFGRQTIELHDRYLAIRTERGGKREESFVWLRDLEPTATYGGRRFLRLAFGPAVMFLAALYAARWVLRHESLPQELALMPVIFGIPFFWYTVVGFMPVPASQFVDRRGNILCEIYGPKGKKHACRDFVKLIEKSIVEEKQAAEPGATDNPDDAQRSREDH